MCAFVDFSRVSRWIRRTIFYTPLFIVGLSLVLMSVKEKYKDVLINMTI